jgi:capsular exopolysaccharide synthesis family protein
VPNWKDHELPELISIDAPRSASSEAYRTLRTNLQFVQHGEDVRVFIVTSGALGEGKTTTVANLGVALAQAGRRIVLVSCDLRRPRLHKFFDLQNETGLSSVLSGQSDLATAMQRAKNLDNVILLASGPIPPNPAELLASDRMRRVVDELRRAADFVIIDTPPLFAVSDALPLAALSDGAILVADAVATTRTAVRHARQQLDQVGARVLGGVLNNFDPYASRYSYSQDGYRYAYTYRYRDEDQPKRPGEDSKANGQSPNADPNGAAKGSGVEISSSENMWS